MASGSALAAIQAAIYSRLHGDSTLLALAPVVGDVNEDQAYPYVLISNATEVPWDTMGGSTTGFGWNATMVVHILSRYAGDLEALNILNRVSTLLNHYALTVSGYTTVICESEDAKMLLEYPNKVEQRHVVARFRIRVHA
jgi:hypothetical protein